MYRKCTSLFVVLIFISSCTPFKKEITQENKVQYYKKLFAYINDSIENHKRKIDIYSNMIDTVNMDTDIFSHKKQKYLLSNIYSYISSSYFTDGKMDSALFYVDRAIIADSLNYTLFYNKACIAQENRMDSLALEYYEKYLSKFETSSSAHYNIAVIYYNAESYNKAIDEFKIALNYENKSSADIYNNLGSAYFQIGKYDDAIAAYNSAIKSDSTLLSVYLNLGEALIKADRLDQAKPFFEKALSSKDELIRNVAVEKIKKIDESEPRL